MHAGPDLVVCGAARAGTSFLASLLGTHPAIDPGAVKEPNFFSREVDRGAGWYDGLFQAREPGLLRLDASMSYTFPHFPDALRRLAEHAPQAVVVYAVREPLGRMLSHYQLHRDYFRNEPATTLGAALGSKEVYAGASDYGRWLGLLRDGFRDDRVVVVPFSVLTRSTAEVLAQICGKLGIDATLIDVQGQAPAQHRNQVVEFRHESLMRARRFVRRNGAYPWLRRSLGPDRLRRIRAVMTRPVQAESLLEALDTCDDEQLLRLRGLYDSAQRAVALTLAEQDARTGLSWASAWSETCPPTGSPALLELAR